MSKKNPKVEPETVPEPEKVPEPVTETPVKPLTLKQEIEKLKAEAKAKKIELETELKRIRETAKAKRNEAKKNGTEKSPVFGRFDSFSSVLSSSPEPLSEKEISEKANALYVEKRGEKANNLKESGVVTSISLKLLGNLSFLVISSREEEKEGKKVSVPIYSVKKI